VLAAHPENPRSSLGDLTELVRSIRSHGILEPLVVLPADDNGEHLLVAGHRRHAAAQLAGTATTVPVVIRAMSPVEVIEAMLSENVNRSDLTVAEEVRAVERLMSLEDGLTPAKLCRRIGRSQAWVRSRMSVTILPVRWRSAIDSGELSLAAAEAAATAADLGPDHLDSVCERLAGARWGDPARAVAGYRDDLRRDAAYTAAVERAQAKWPTVCTTDDPPPERAKRLGELFDPDGCKAHRGEPCHAVVVRRTSWGDGFEVNEVCADPPRHNPTRVENGNGSELASDRTRSAPNPDDSHAKRKGRLARLDLAATAFAKSRGGISQSDLTRLALRGLISEAGREAVGFAATILRYDQPREVTTADLLDSADTPAALVRVAGAVAAGLAETAMYWSSGSQPCRDYLATLTATGWTPDDWTAAVLARHTDTGAEHTDDDEADAGDADDDGGDDSDEDDLAG
ncbi:MAG: ParB/RepB/Spo0J family partition protein, partial [Acidimicrobiales bacterium]